MARYDGNGGGKATKKTPSMSQQGNPWGSGGNPVGYIGFKGEAAPVRPIPTPPRPAPPKFAPAAARRIVSGKSVGSNAQGRITSIAPPKITPVKTATNKPTTVSKSKPIFQATPQIAPSPMGIDQWLAGDTAYKDQTDAAQKSLQDYIAQMNGQQNFYNTEEARNKGALGDQRKLATDSMTDDYASRGMLQSGLALKALADLSTDYDKRGAALDQGAAEFTGNANTAYQNFQSTQGINANQYKNDAIARRALQYNLK